MRESIVSKINNVTEGAKRSGHLNPLRSRDHVKALSDYTIWLKYLEDPDEFRASVTYWIALFTRVVFDGTENKQVLKRVADSQPGYEWIKDFIDIQELL